MKSFDLTFSKVSGCQLACGKQVNLGLSAKRLHLRCKPPSLRGNAHEMPFLFASFFFAAHTDKEKAADEFASARGLCKNNLPNFQFTIDISIAIVYNSNDILVCHREGRDIEHGRSKAEGGRDPRQCSASL